MKSVNLLNNYQHNGKGRVKVGEAFSSWQGLLYGVPQGSIFLGSLLFNLFCDLFKRASTASYADNTTPWNASLTQELIINKLEELSSIDFKRFNNNFMKVNSDNSHILMSRNKKSFVNINDVSSQRM